MATAGKKENDSAKALTERVRLLSRELEVEAALEKVRSRAMAMRSSDKLAEISAVMFRQIQVLGIDATRCGVGIFDDNHDAMEVWLTTAEAGEKVMRVLDYVNLHIHPVYENILAARKKKKPYAITVLKGEEVKHYYDTLAAYMEGAGHKALNKEEAFQSFFFEQGAINITTKKPLSEEERAIMVRFAKVFGLIYLRFVDLQKAELQANEARVEAALERVRGRSLAMQKSDELPEVAALLYHELRQLGAGRHLYSGYAVISESEPIHHLHLRVPGSKIWEEYSMTVDAAPLYNQIHETWKQQESFFYRAVGGTELKSLSARARKSNAVITKELNAFKRLADPTVLYSFNFSEGYLHVASDSLLNDDEEALLLRLAKVFELAFRRFIDIRKAEAQAREAMIEAALERIRARAMAMHTSAELMDVADVLREQMALLGQPELETSALHFYNEEPDHIVSWRAFRLGTKTTGKISKGRMAIPKESCRLAKEWVENFNKGLTEYTLEISGAKQREWYKILFHLAPEVGEAMIKRKSTAEPRYYHFSTFSGGALLMVAIRPPSDESIYLQRRAAAVFDLAYRRFLDLKQAEELEREARIELALERVRARAMAMQRSDELRDLIGIVMDQFHELGIPVDLANFNFHSRTRDWTMWLARPGLAYPSLIHLPYIEHPLFDGPRQAVKRGDTFYSDVLTREEGLSAMKHFSAHSSVGDDPPEVKARIRKAAGLARSIEFGTHVSLTISRFDAVPYSDDQNAVLRRLSRVFEQAYTRFIDLQKAEAQAREAQIEAALERVRARTMAMHKSEQLPETAQVLFEQFAALGELPDRIGIGIFNEQLHVVEWWVTDQAGSQVTHKFNATMLEPTHAKAYAAWKQGKDSLVIELTGKALKEWVRFVKFEVKMPIDESNIKDRRVHHMAFFSAGVLLISAHEALPAATLQLLVRFATVFSQTYTRFLDLQKAEAQAREGQIQLAMERVRARTMAMQKSDELPEAANLLFLQVQSLGMPAWSAGYCIWDDDKKAITLWMSSEGVMQPSFKLPLTEDPSCIHFLEAHQRGEAFYVEAIGGEELVKHYNYMKSLPVVGEVLQSIIDAGFPLPTFQIFHCAYFSKGFLLFITYEPVPDAHDIFKRFGKVFEQTYTRFLDLQKAEVQAREAQIEAALERVRSRTMAMHRSEELSECAELLFSELTKMGGSLWSSGFAILENNDQGEGEYRTTDQFGTREEVTYIPHTWDSTMRELYEGWKQGKTYHRIDLGGKAVKEHYDNMLALPRSGQVFQAVTDAGSEFPAWQQMHAAYFKQGYLLVISLTHYTNSELLVRFARVFEQTYTRFLDLQKAEAQAREAKIEASVERVRSRTTAMHRSDELSEVSALMYRELQTLGLTSFINCGYVEIDEKAGIQNAWMTNADGSGVGLVQLPLFGDPVFDERYEAWKRKDPLFYQSVGGKLLIKHIEFSTQHYRETELDDMVRSRFADPTVFYCSNFSHGYLHIVSDSLLSPEEESLLIRFTRVFEQTYTRFLDLQKAEAQAREATIEAALERVRAKAMAMHNSHDLAEAAGTVLGELKNLGINPRRFAVGLVDKASRSVQSYSFLSSVAGDTLGLTGSIVLSGNPILEKVYASWESGEDFFTELQGEMYRTYYEAIAPALSLPPISQAQLEQKNYGTFICVPVGYVVAWTEEPIDVADVKILKRFASIIDLTFRRYRELQNSEAIAKAAVQQASLDRVRAEIASMRHADDLQRITPLMWRELRTLGVPFFRCGVLIINEDKQKLDYYLSTPEGHPLAALHLDFNTPIETVQNALHHWRRQKEYIAHWSKEQFVAFARSMMELGQIQTMKSYQGGDKPPESITLQFIPFAQGMLYVGSGDALSPDQINLVHALADAFSTAYARYEDFTRLEAAKATVERALSELRTTQNQLVQSEKMASLGELTAGIAHEIQNPLNFVNNFSEVSKELLEEMEAELKNGKSEDALQLAKDIIQNLEKITFHGKRADGIVKSMLQHSRKSTGQKELTDINALCDEYLRLSYHGLRAKDKSFNAKFETDLDPAVGSLIVLPQDIGRVVLNLINNAFYAVTEKKKTNPDNFEPTVTVTTRRAGSTVEIEVADNGNGIPASIKDKIFQPFFTTKPTGQGTGLGLSLSYDIITKVHGGKIAVETKENLGTTFTIHLPSS